MKDTRAYQIVRGIARAMFWSTVIIGFLAICDMLNRLIY